MKKWLIEGIITWAITAILSTVIVVYLTPQYVSGRWKPAVIGLLMIIMVAVYYALSRLLRFLRYAIAYYFLRKKLGIVKIFKNLISCQKEIKEDFVKAKDIELFLQIGRLQLGAATASMFGPLAEGKTGPEDDIKVLHASKDSYYVKKAADVRNSSLKHLRAGIQATEEELDHLMQNGVKIQSFAHKEPFVWKFFVFDDIVYVMGYTPTDADKTSLVYKIKDGKHSLYRFFKKYFEDVWERASDKKGDLPSPKETKI